MKLKSIQSIKNLKNKKVLLRVDFNVPFKNGRIKDDFRIKAGLPTIKFLLSKGASIIILNHLGRPKGQVVAELSNKPIAARLSKLINRPVIQASGVIGPVVTQLTQKLSAGQILMLENVRFNDQEEKNGRKFAKNLAGLGNWYVNDAFAVCHRLGSSVSAITEYLPSAAGFLLEQEISNLSKVLESPLRPKVAIIGGAKLETKVKVLKNLLAKMDYVLMGGAIANNILKAMNYDVGQSLVDDSQLKLARQILNNKLRVPIDVVVAGQVSATAKPQIKAVGLIKKHEIILDLGPETAQLYLEIIKSAKLVVWNGPLGYFEIPKYKKSSEQVARGIASLKLFSVIGGGETVQMIKGLGLEKKFSFVSTGGGAMLEFLEGKMLPGIKPLIK